MRQLCLTLSRAKSQPTEERGIDGDVQTTGAAPCCHAMSASRNEMKSKARGVSREARHSRSTTSCQPLRICEIISGFANHKYL